MYFFLSLKFQNTLKLNFTLILNIFWPIVGNWVQNIFSNPSGLSIQAGTLFGDILVLVEHWYLYIVWLHSFLQKPWWWYIVGLLKPWWWYIVGLLKPWWWYIVGLLKPWWWVIVVLLKPKPSKCHKLYTAMISSKKEFTLKSA